MSQPEGERIANTLRNLMETCRESEAGLLRAASRSQKTGLKEFFGTEALQQSLFAAELELELKKLGVSSKNLKRRQGKLRAWKEIRGTHLLPSGDQTVLFLCEWGERAALEEYLAALQAVYLPAYCSLWNGSIRNCKRLMRGLIRFESKCNTMSERNRAHTHQEWSEPDARVRDIRSAPAATQFWSSEISDRTSRLMAAR